MKHNARSTVSLFTAAQQGTQFPCGSIADHHPQTIEGDRERDACPQCRERRELMSAAYQQGQQDAAERLPLYDADTRKNEYRNAIAAYAATATEPAVSYLVGYAGGLAYT